MLEAPRYTVPTTCDPVRGNPAAPVTIVEFSDYQCPFCARVNPTLARIRETYGDRVKIVFKDYPLPNHPQAPKAAEAARCAGEQNKYWEMHDAMFANQRALEVPMLKQTARAIGLDGGAFDQCIDSNKRRRSERHDSRADGELNADAVRQRTRPDRRDAVRELPRSSTKSCHGSKTSSCAPAPHP
jgi:protein-disulfide isomerase